MVISGAICLFRLPVSEYPELAPPQIQVATSYSGADAKVVAETVAIPL